MPEGSVAERLFEVFEHFDYYQAMGATVFAETDIGGTKVQLRDADHLYMEGSVTGADRHRVYADEYALMARAEPGGEYHAELQFFGEDPSMEEDYELDDVKVVGGLL